MINYTFLINKGFKRIELNCEVALERYGFKDFILVKKISKKVFMEWTWERPHEVKLMRIDKQGNILKQCIIADATLLNVL